MSASEIFELACPAKENVSRPRCTNDGLRCKHSGHTERQMKSTVFMKCIPRDEAACEEFHAQNFSLDKFPFSFFLTSQRLERLDLSSMYKIATNKIVLVQLKICHS